MLELYLGGARSGKSRLAETQAQTRARRNNRKLIYLATATADDQEMADRISRHRQSRYANHNSIAWHTIEEPLALSDVLVAHNSDRYCIVVDCLTLWVSNLLLHPATEKWPTERQRLLDCLDTLSCDIVFVSNEVGQGIVPANALARRFVDESGFLHQALAKRCDRVVFVVAGLPQVLKGEPL